MRGPKGSPGTVLLCEAAAWRGHTVGPELGRPRWQGDGWKLQRRLEGFEGAKRQSRNGKEVSARSRCLAWPHSWPRAGEATAGKATAGSCREGSRVLRGPTGSLGTVRKLLREAAAWRGHTVAQSWGGHVAGRRLEAAEKVRGF